MGRRNDSLDGLRAVAVLAVVLFHAGALGGGYFGVDVFFVLSGFLITGVLLGEWRERGRVSLRRFYARRALRLYPALLVMLVALTPLAPGLAGDWLHWGRAAALAATYTSDLVAYASNHTLATTLNVLGPTWSLAVEEQFYLLWPVALIVLLRRSVDPRRAAVALVAIAVVLLLPLAAVTHRAFYFRPDFRFGDLLLGCALALVLADRPPAPGSRSWRLLGAVVPVAAAFVAVAMVVVDQVSPTLSFAAWSLGVAVGSVLVVARLALADQGTAARLLARRPLRRIGVWSYAIYLWNVPLITIIEPRLAAHGVGRTAIAIVCVLATIAVGAASHRFVELPFLRIKARLRGTPVAGLGPAPGRRFERTSRPAAPARSLPASAVAP